MPRPASLETNPAPAQVGPYRVERKLGSGGMGTVYLACHEQTGQRVAVKVLAPSLAREAGLVARFIREIDALQKLKNPHVVELYDHGVDGDMYYYAMEYVDGETLTARLRRERRLPWREVVDLSIQICIALKAAHDAGIIHRDLKPSNLLLAPDGRIKLTDFGVAHVFAGSKLTITGGIIGTAEYMSPEQGQGQRITNRSDLYSLGAVMYVMLTGRPPFSGKTTLDVVQKHKYSQIDRPRLIVPEIPHWLDEVVCQLMEKDPDKRFADAFVANRRLQEVLRKVELSSDQGTLADGSASGDATTMQVGSASVSGRGTGGGAGPGTLMRDLFRAQLDQEKARSSIWSVFENTAVLVVLMIGLVAGMGYWTFHKRTSPEQQFEKGVALLDADEEANWRTVRDDYFAPLVEFKTAEWDEKLEPYLKRIRLRELTSPRSTTGSRRARVQSGPASEVERILILARHQQDAGDFSGAERSLKSLAALLKDNSQFQAESRLVEHSLRQLDQRRAELSSDVSFIDSALKRAAVLQRGGKAQEAAAIWQGIIDLYGNDPHASANVERARRKLAERSSKNPQTKGSE